jgi:hypothetical protein
MHTLSYTLSLTHACTLFYTPSPHTLSSYTLLIHSPHTGVTHHEYIEVDSSSFTSPSKLDLNGQIAKAFNDSVRKHDLPLPVHIYGGEIGPHNGGSAALLLARRG